MSLRWRLALLVAAGTAMLYLALGIVFTHQLRANLNASVDGDLAQSAGFMSRILEFQAVNYQFGEQQLVIAPGAEFPSLAPPGSHGSPLFGQLFAPDGTLVGSVDLPTAEALLSPSQVGAARNGPIHLDAHPSGVSGTVRLLAEPSSALPGFVQVTGIPLGTGPDAEHGVVIGLVIFFGPVVALAGLAAWLLASAALRPVDRMREQAEAISAHDDDVRLAVPRTRDELAKLAGTMNDLLERLHGALVRQKRFVSDAGHELRTPIAILQGELELASRPGRSPDELKEAISAASSETLRLGRLTEDLLQLAKGDEGHLVLSRVPVDLAAIVAEAAERTRVRADAAGVAIEIDATGPVEIAGDEIRIGQALANLLDNALRYTPRGSRVHVNVRRVLDDAVVEVIDEGPGFPPEYISIAFERFRRPDSARGRADGGSGLGLAIVRSIAQAHGGHAEAGNVEPCGARVALYIPVLGSGAGSAAVVPSATDGAAV